MGSLNVWMRADLTQAGWSVRLWKCPTSFRPVLPAHRVACYLDVPTCWTLFEDLQDRWRGRGIELRWATASDGGLVRVPRYQRDLDQLQEVAADAVGAAERVMFGHLPPGG